MDIVERLRDPESMHGADDVDLHLDAVDEIERLRQQNAELVEQINKLKQPKNNNWPSYPDDGFGGSPMQYDYTQKQR